MSTRLRPKRKAEFHTCAPIRSSSETSLVKIFQAPNFSGIPRSSICFLGIKGALAPIPGVNPPYLSTMPRTALLRILVVY